MPTKSSKLKIVAASEGGKIRVTVEIDKLALDNVAKLFANSDASEIRKAQAFLTIVNDILQIAEKPLSDALIERINLLER